MSGGCNFSGHRGNLCAKLTPKPQILTATATFTGSGAIPSLTSSTHPLEYARSGDRVSTPAEVVKLVDTLASGASARKGVEVQVLSSAPIKEGSLTGAFFVSRSDSRPAPGRNGNTARCCAGAERHAFCPLSGTNPIINQYVVNPFRCKRITNCTGTSRPADSDKPWTTSTDNGRKHRRE